MSAIVVAALLGLIIGSFLNVCIHRIPLGESIVLPPSACPHCKAAIRPWHNIPLASFLVLKGRCAGCGAKISWVYPLVEATTGAIFVGAYLRWGLSAQLGIVLLFVSGMLVLMFIDLFHRLLPDVVTLPGILVGLVLSPWQSREYFAGDPFLPEPTSWWIPLLHSIVGVVLGGGVLWLVAWAYRRLRRIEAMGMGDIKMMAMVGAFLGWRYAWLTIFFGSLSGAVIGTLYIRLSGKGKRYELPFGTFLAAGGIAAAFWGPALLDWYFGFFRI